jgi:integrase
VFRWATDNSKITSNTAAELFYTAKADPRIERQDFSADDMRLILTECRKAHNPVVRITNLIAAFSGARLAEIVEANTLDFRTEGEHLSVPCQARKPGTNRDPKDRRQRSPLPAAFRDPGRSGRL